MSSVDKQAMVEDWLNPELTGGDVAAPDRRGHVADNAPQVQHKQAGDNILAGQCPCPGLCTSAGTSAQQKNLKVDLVLRKIVLCIIYGKFINNCVQVGR